MEMSYIDYLSNNGKGYLHKSSVMGKIFLTIATILSVILINNLIYLLIITGILIILLITNKIPIITVIKLCGYAIIFSLLFAIIKFNQSIGEGLVIILKAVNSALTMLLLITTTPYLKVFSFIGIILPNIIVDAMFFTYRMFFILIKDVQKALTIIKIRGGFRPTNIIFNIKNLSKVIGTIIIKAFDISERMYSIYSLRGYQDKLFLKDNTYKIKRNDYIPISIGLIIITMAVITWQK